MKTLLATVFVALLAISAMAAPPLPPVNNPPPPTPTATPYRIPEPEPEPTQQYEQFTATRVFHPHGPAGCGDPACTTCTKAAAPQCAKAADPSCAATHRLPPAGDPTCAAYGPAGDPTCAAYGPAGDPTCAAEQRTFLSRGAFAPSIFTYATESGPQWNFPVYRIVKRETVERPVVWIQGMHVYYKDRQLAYKQWSLEREEFEASRAQRDYTATSCQLGSSATAGTMREYVRAEAKYTRKTNNVAIKQAELACELEEQLARRARLQMKRDNLNYRD